MSEMGGLYHKNITPRAFRKKPLLQVLDQKNIFQIDDGLRLQTDDIEMLGKQVKEISVELDIKKEMRNRVTMGELTITKRKPWRNIIKIVDDPLSEWNINSIIIFIICFD